MKKIPNCRQDFFLIETLIRCSYMFLSIAPLPKQWGGRLDNYINAQTWRLLDLKNAVLDCSAQKIDARSVDTD